MRRLLLAVGPGDAAGLDRAEAETAFRVGAGAAEAGKFRIRPLLVGGMRVTSGGVSLPDFDHGIVDRRAVAVEHAAFDADALTGSVRRDQVIGDRLVPWIILPGRERGCEKRSDRLRRRDAWH